MVRNLAKKAMTTEGQKASFVIDHLVEALGNEPSSSLRRAEILIDIDQHPGTSQVGIMERLQINKSNVVREIDWLFNYGCIMISDNKTDARQKHIHICGYSKTGLEAALDYFNGDHAKILQFIRLYDKVIRQEKPTLRDAKIVAMLYEKKKASKQDILSTLYDGSASTNNRAFNKMLDDKIIKGGAA